jgi:hypothetical protein
MALSVSDLTARVRVAIDDVAGGKPVLQENLRQSRVGNQVNGTNKNFQVNNTRVESGTYSIVADGAAVSPSGTPDYFRGRFVLAGAPATSLLVSYDFQFFTDTEIARLLQNALSFVGSTDDTFASVDVGLGDALVYKASSDAASALAARTSPYYDASAGSKSARKGDLGRKYRELAKDLFDRAVAEREQFYGPRKGQATQAAYGKSSPTSNIVQPYTPRR